MHRLLVGTFAALTLTGCAATPAASTPTPTPTTPAAATPQQFASIIAGEKADWRKVIDGASDCRFLWVLGAESAADEANAMSCYLQESTIIMSAGTAADEIRELTPSSEIESLVTETLKALDAISGVDLEGACGEAFEGPKDTKECNEILGSLMWKYDSLETALDKWAPYM